VFFRTHVPSFDFRKVATASAKMVDAIRLLDRCRPCSGLGLDGILTVQLQSLAKLQAFLSGHLQRDLPGAPDADLTALAGLGRRTSK
jgi:hypothetical protein